MIYEVQQGAIQESCFQSSTSESAFWNKLYSVAPSEVTFEGTQENHNWMLLVYLVAVTLTLPGGGGRLFCLQCIFNKTITRRNIHFPHQILKFKLLVHANCWVLEMHINTT